MFCNNCGQKLPEGAEFCTNCGAKQEGSKANQPSQNRQRPVNIPATPPQQRSTSTKPGIRSQEEPELITTKDYILMMILLAIPIVGIVFMFIWGFGSETAINRKNYARAILIMMAISIVLSILITVVMGALTASMMSNMYY